MEYRQLLKKRPLHNNMNEQTKRFSDYNAIHERTQSSWTKMVKSMLNRKRARKLLSIIVVLTLISGAFLFLGNIVGANTATPIKIMPLGDSITEGYPGQEGYRRILYQNLTGHEFYVDFVGSQENGTGFDNDNEGHLGFYANYIRDNIKGWLTSNPADCILLHIGTNDISDGQDAAGIVTEVSSTLDNIDQWASDRGVIITVFLARIILRTDNQTLSTLTHQYNTLLGSMAAQRNASGDHIFVVDMENALNYPVDLIQNDSYPGIHPNPTGYKKMADLWYDAITDFLGYKLTLNKIGHGIITALPYQRTYASDTTVTLSATPENGWTFSGWSGDLNGTSNPTSIIIDNNKAVTATYTQNQYTLTMATSFGSVTPTAGDHSYLSGSTEIISATPPSAGSDEEYTWLGWSGTGIGSYTGMNTTVVITINGQITQTALWGHEYKLKLSTNQGTTMPSVGEYWSEAGTQITITATPIASTADIRPLWLGWAGSGSSSYTGTNNSATISMNGPVTETAQWTTEYKVIVNNSGIPLPSTIENWYKAGSQITVQAIPEAAPSGTQYVCWGWTGTGSVPHTGSDNSVTCIINAPSNITWLWKTQYYLTVNSQYGTPGGGGWYDAGSSVFATVNPTVVSQFSFTGWSGDATGTTSPSNAIVMDNPKLATAKWASTQTSTPAPTPNPTIKPTPTSSTPTPSETVSPTPSLSETATPSTPVPSSSKPQANNGVLIQLIIFIAVASTVIATLFIKKIKKPSRIN
jgi:uncharacterized repeat protein (TIGR02543 family)